MVDYEQQQALQKLEDEKNAAALAEAKAKAQAELDAFAEEPIATASEGPEDLDGETATD